MISSEHGDSVMIDFAVLEPGDGVRLRIVFDGQSDSALTFGGSCIGSAKVRVLAPDPVYFISRNARFVDRYMRVVMGLPGVKRQIGASSGEPDFPRVLAGADAGIREAPPGVKFA